MYIALDSSLFTCDELSGHGPQSQFLRALVRYHPHAMHAFVPVWVNPFTETVYNRLFTVYCLFTIFS